MSIQIQQTGSHLDHLLRQTRQHHVQLSSMADTKANSLITISAVMITFSAPFLVRPPFQSAVVILIAFSWMTIVLATFAVMPTTPIRIAKQGAEKSLEQPERLLFFGTFVGMEGAEYEAAMNRILNDPSLVYAAQVREIFVLGNFLARKKYRFLRFAYMSFTAGLFLSGLVLILSTVI